MPRYFFHIDDGTLIPDNEGTELPDLDTARAEAVRAAGEMLKDLKGGFWRHPEPWIMHVTDEKGLLQLTLQFSAKVPSGKVKFLPET